MLIDTGAGISIFRENTVQHFPERVPENLTIQGITNEKLLITQSCLIPFITKDPHKVFIYDLDIEFDGLLGLDFLEHYQCVIDLPNKQLKTNFKTLPLYKVGEPETLSINQTLTNRTPTDDILKQELSYPNNIQIDGRTDQIFKLKCNLNNTDAILYKQEKDKVRIPNAIVHVNEHGEFFTSIVNVNAIPKTIDFSDIQLEPFDSAAIESTLHLDEPKNTEQTNRTQEIKNQLRTDHLNEEEN